MKINGKEIAQSLFQDLQKRVDALKEKNIVPHVAIIVVGQDPASIAYVGQKQKKAESIGAKATIYHLPESTTQEELVQILEKLNTDPLVHGIIVQRPLPPHINGAVITEQTSSLKDIDGFHKDTKFPMPLPKAVLKVLQKVFEETKATKGTNETQETNGKLSSVSFDPSDPFLAWLTAKNIVIIGKGETGGMPIRQALETIGITPMVIDSKTQNPTDVAKNADILITTVGKEGIVTKDMLKPGSILVGVGMYRGHDDKLHADYNDEDIAPVVSFYTSVPGGVGPVNVAMLLENLITAAEVVT